MASGLEDLAKRLESLDSVVPDAVAKGLQFAREQVLKAGQSGGPCHEGNATAAKIEIQGNGLKITRVASKEGFGYGIRSDFLALWIANAALREAAARIRGGK